MYLYLSVRNDAQEVCFGLTYIMYCPLFYDAHESYSNAANSFDSFFFFLILLILLSVDGTVNISFVKDLFSAPT